MSLAFLRRADPEDKQRMSYFIVLYLTCSPLTVTLRISKNIKLRTCTFLNDF